MESREPSTRQVGDPPTPTVLDADSADDLPSSIGRYEILERVGQGGMGVVYRARDPELDRIVAVKLVRPGTGDAEARARLVREAQALAKLAHANVVPVYDVGTLGTRVFVAMEFVHGTTLSQWLTDRHPWRDVLAMLVPAGRGLAAAHAAGLLHRDFKLDNVMLGDDGRVRVMDFGLARTEHTQDSDPPSTRPSLASGDSLRDQLTEAGVVMGTPAYMAPEQHAGRELDARADQYAFCVALYRALYGERPFGGDTYAELVHRKETGDIRPAPTAAQVPRWLRSAVLRGLRPRRADRFVDMNALLAALDPTRRSRKMLGWAGGIATIAAASVMWQVSRPQAQTRDCREAGKEIEDVWNEEQRTTIRGAFESTKTAFALRTFDTAAAKLDQYATRLSELQVEACRRLESSQDEPELEDRRRSCLKQRKAELGALVQRLAEADPTVVKDAVSRTAALPSLEACEEEDILAATVAPPPPRVEQEVSNIREALAHLGQKSPITDAEIEEARELVARARTTAYDPVTAEALFGLGELLRDRGTDKQAGIETFTEAYHAASSCSHDVTAFAAANQLTFELGFSAGRFEQAEIWADHARASLARLGFPPDQEVHFRISVASIYQEKGPYEKAEAQYERVLELYETELGIDHPAYPNALNGYGDLLRRMDRLDEARTRLEQAIAASESLHGPSHPSLFSPVGNLAVVARMQGDLDTAAPLLERHVDLAKEIYGPQHPNVALTMGNYANLLWERGEFQACYQLNTEVTDRLEETLGDEHPAYAMAMDNAGLCLVELGRHDEAHPLISRALQIRQATLGEAHPEVARSLAMMGRIANLSGRFEQAVEHFERGIEIMEDTVGLEHRDALSLFVGLAAAQEGLGHDERARSTRLRLLQSCQAIDPDLDPCQEARRRTQGGADSDRTP